MSGLGFAKKPKNPRESRDYDDDVNPRDRAPEPDGGAAYNERRNSDYKRGRNSTSARDHKEFETQNDAWQRQQDWRKRADSDADRGRDGAPRGYPDMRERWVPEIQKSERVSRQEAERRFDEWFKRRVRRDHPDR